MAVKPTVIINSKRVENSQTTQYTSTGLKTMIDSFKVTNTTGTPATFSANLVPSGGTAGDDNLFIDAVSIDAGETYHCPELVGQTLGSGDFISTLAGTATALTMRASGRTSTN